MLQLCTAYFQCIPELHGDIQRQIKSELEFLSEQLQLKENALAERKKALDGYLASLSHRTATNMNQSILSATSANNAASNPLSKNPR